MTYKPPYLGLQRRPFPYRWTGQDPDPVFVTRLAKAMKTAKTNEEKYAAIRMVWEDPTGWAFTRFMYEDQLSYSGWSKLRKKRVTALLNTLPPWPFEPTPTGWGRDGFPEDFI